MTGIENIEKDPHKRSHLISDKGAKAIQWSKNNFFQQMVLEQLDIPKTKNEPHSKLHTFVLSQNGS